MTVDRNAHNGLPTYFLAHGSPMLALTPIAAHKFLQSLGKDLAQPKAIVIMSPHWETTGLRVNAAGPLKTIHDFHGFPPALYQIQYPADATPELVDEVVDLLEKSGETVSKDNTWGLDHGSWVPLSLVFPNLNVPVVQVSVPHGSTPESIFKIGKSLAPLRREGILVLGSGGTVHNLREIRQEGAPAPEWSKAFDAYLDKGLSTGRIESFSDLYDLPDFRRAHPTEEHLLPLFFAMGAAADDEGEAPEPDLIHRSYSHGSLSMSYFRFGEAA